MLLFVYLFSLLFFVVVVFILSFAVIIMESLMLATFRSLPHLFHYSTKFVHIHFISHIIFGIRVSRLDGEWGKIARIAGKTKSPHSCWLFPLFETWRSICYFFNSGGRGEIGQAHSIGLFFVTKTVYILVIQWIWLAHHGITHMVFAFFY